MSIALNVDFTTIYFNKRLTFVMPLYKWCNTMKQACLQQIMLQHATLYAYIILCCSTHELLFTHCTLQIQNSVGIVLEQMQPFLTIELSISIELFLVPHACNSIDVAFCIYRILQAQNTVSFYSFISLQIQYFTGMVLHSTLCLQYFIAMIFCN